jgi:hypothetical protein
MGESLTQPCGVSQRQQQIRPSCAAIILAPLACRNMAEILTPADVYFGRGQTILIERETIKRKTIGSRLLHRRQAA